MNPRLSVEAKISQVQKLDLSLAVEQKEDRNFVNLCQNGVNRPEA